MHLLYQAILAISSTPYLNVGDYEGRIGLPPPTADPSTEGYKAKKGSLYRRHHVYTINYYSSAGQEHPSLSGVFY
jgi:hypothetical protein